MKDNISFKGTFIINYKNTIPGIKEGFEKAISDHKRITFNNYRNKDTVLYVLKNSKDYGAANFIQKNRIKFQYLPDVDTKLRFEPQFPELVTKYIKDTKPRIINKISELMDFVSKNRIHNRAKYGSESNWNKYFLQKNNINITGKAVKDSQGVTTIKDEINSGKAVISPESKLGTRYVFIKPGNKYEDPMYLAADKKGNIIAKFVSPDEILNFRIQFKKAIKKTSSS